MKAFNGWMYGRTQDKEAGVGCPGQARLEQHPYPSILAQRSPSQRLRKPAGPPWFYEGSPHPLDNKQLFAVCIAYLKSTCAPAVTILLHCATLDYPSLSYSRTRSLEHITDSVNDIMTMQPINQPINQSIHPEEPDVMS